MEKIKELKEDSKAIEKIFSPPNLNIVVSNAVQEYCKNTNENLCEEDKIVVSNYFREHLISLRKQIDEKKKGKCILSQLEYLFNKVTYYSFDDALTLKNLTYSHIRKFILNYSPIEEKIGNDIMKIIYNISYNNSIMKIFKDLSTNYVEDLIKKLLGNEYNIETHVYGSSLYGLNLVSSDIDIRICYEEKDKISKREKNILNYLYNLLIKENKKNGKFKINKIDKAKIPLIKLEIDISDIINSYLCMFNNEYSYLNFEDIKKVKFDISFSHGLNSIELQNINKMTELIKEDLNKNPLIKPIVLIFKLILEKNNLNSESKGLNSTSVIFLTKNIIKTYEKEIVGTYCQKFGKIYRLFLEKFSKYDFTYGIDEKGLDFKIDNNKDKFIIVNPIEINCIYVINNIANNCSKVEEIKSLFKNLLEKFYKNKSICINFKNIETH